MDIFPSISRSKGNQTMKFGKLTEKHKKHFSWKIMHRMRWRNYSQTLFWRKKIEHKSFIQFVFLHAKLRNIRKLSYRLLAVTLYLAFSFLKKQKTNKDLELVSLPHYLYNFWKKNIFILLYSIRWPSFIVWLPLLREILGNVCCNCLLTKLWRHEFWNKSYLSNQTVFFRSILKTDESLDECRRV